MVKVIEENFMVCCDCLSAIACDDYTGLDYHYNESEAEKRMEEIKRGIENAGGYIVYGDSDY